MNKFGITTGGDNWGILGMEVDIDGAMAVVSEVTRADAGVSALALAGETRCIGLLGVELWSHSELASGVGPTPAVAAMRSRWLGSFRGKLRESVSIFKRYTDYELAEKAYCEGMPGAMIVANMRLGCLAEDFEHGAKRLRWHIKRARVAEVRQEHVMAVIEATSIDASVAAVEDCINDLRALAGGIREGMTPAQVANLMRAKGLLVERLSKLGLNVADNKREQARNSATRTLGNGGVTINVGSGAKVDWSKVGGPIDV